MSGFGPHRGPAELLAELSVTRRWITLLDTTTNGRENLALNRRQEFFIHCRHIPLK